MSWGSRSNFHRPWPMLYVYTDEAAGSYQPYYDGSGRAYEPQHESSSHRSRKKHRKRRSSNTNSSNNRPYHDYTEEDVRDMYTLDRPVLSISFPRPSASTLPTRNRSRDPYAKKKARWQQKVKLPTIKELSESIRSRSSTSSSVQGRTRANSVSTAGSVRSISEMFPSVGQEKNLGYELPETPVPVPNSLLQRQLRRVLEEEQMPEPYFSKLPSHSEMGNYQNFEDSESDTSSYRESSTCCGCSSTWRNVCIFVFFLLLVGGAAAGVAVYFALKDSGATTAAPSPDLKYYIMKLHLNNGNYTTNLADPTSEGFKKIENDICTTSNVILQNSILTESYKNCSVLDMKSGSIIANAKLTFYEDALAEEAKRLSNSTTIEDAIASEIKSGYNSAVLSTVKSFVDQYQPRTDELIVFRYEPDITTTTLRSTTPERITTIAEQGVSTTNQPTSIDASEDESTAAPIASTVAPIESTAAPIASTAAPVASTVIPVASTAEPIASTAESVVSTAAPEASTADSVIVSTAEQLAPSTQNPVLLSTENSKQQESTTEEYQKESTMLVLISTVVTEETTIAVEQDTTTAQMGIGHQTTESNEQGSLISTEKQDSGEDTTRITEMNEQTTWTEKDLSTVTTVYSTEEESIQVTNSENDDSSQG